MSAENATNIASKIEGILIILGMLMFLLLHIAATMYMGFEIEKMGNQPNIYENPLLRLSPTEFWLLTAIVGMTSGIMINYRRFVIAGISGLAGALGIVGFTMLYISWREWYAFVETIIMLSIGMIPGIAVFNFLSAKFPIKSIIMCQNGQQFKLCTCHGKPLASAEYRWTLEKYVGDSLLTMDGMLIEPDFELSAELTDRFFLTELNERQCFDFDYIPSKGDNLCLYNPRNKNYRFLSFLFQNGQWTLGSYNPFTEQTEEFNQGKISFE